MPRNAESVLCMPHLRKYFPVLGLLACVRLMLEQFSFMIVTIACKHLWCVAYAGRHRDAHTPYLFGSAHESVPTSTPREDPDDHHKKHTQSTQEHFLPKFRTPSS